MKKKIEKKSYLSEIMDPIEFRSRMSEALSGSMTRPTFSSRNKMLSFDWDRAARIIKDRYEKHPDLVAEAGLQGDWSPTADTIFRDGEPIIKHDAYLTSGWATPTLILNYDGKDQEEIECYVPREESRMPDSSRGEDTWDEISLGILNM